MDQSRRIRPRTLLVIVISLMLLVGLIGIPILVSVFSREEHSFVVEDEQNTVLAATLVLCGSETPLQRMGGRLAVSKHVDCEGSGHIRLRYASGDEHDCIVGYVTPAAEQNLIYLATDKGCE